MSTKSWQVLNKYCDVQAMKSLKTINYQSHFNIPTDGQAFRVTCLCPSIYFSYEFFENLSVFLFKKKNCFYLVNFLYDFLFSCFCCIAVSC